MPRRARSSAGSIAGAVWPVAVGPPMTTRGASITLCERAPQRVRAGMVDTGLDEPSDEGRGTRDVDELVLARAAGQVDDAVGQVREGATRLRRPVRLVVLVLVATARHDGVHEDLRGPPDPRQIPLEPDPFLGGQQLDQPPALLGWRDVVDEAGRRCSGPLAV